MVARKHLILIVLPLMLAALACTCNGQELLFCIQHVLFWLSIVRLETPEAWF